MLEQLENSPLRQAIRDAKNDESFRQDALYAMRELEYARLVLLQDRLKALFAEIPPHIDLFDLGLKAGEKPRLWIDMVAFVEMAADKRHYRFFQDTRAGRMIVAEKTDLEEMAKDVLSYVAKRLVAREQLLAMPMTQNMQPQEVETPLVPVIASEADAIVTEPPKTIAVEQTNTVVIEPQKVDFITAAKMAAREEANRGGKTVVDSVEAIKKPSFFKSYGVFILFFLAVASVIAAVASKFL